MSYRIVTLWQGEPEWEILVMVPKEFSTVYSAKKFVRMGREKLFIDSQTNKLILTMAENSYIIYQDLVKVGKLKPESEDKIMVTSDDFEQKEIYIKDFSQVDGLNRGFCSLAYTIIDSNNKPIECQ